MKLPHVCSSVAEDICSMRWERLGTAEPLQISQVYYYFSMQFRENLMIACRLHPNDTNLQKLSFEECDTDNLSPWPDVAAQGEKMDHDEFMRRLLLLVD